MALTNQSQLQQLILIYKNHSQTQPLCCNNKYSIPHRENKNSNQQYKHTFHKNNKKHKDKKTKHNKIYLNQLQYKNKNNWNNHMKYFRLNNNRYLHLISQLAKLMQEKSIILMLIRKVEWFWVKMVVVVIDILMLYIYMYMFLI